MMQQIVPVTAIPPTLGSGYYSSALGNTIEVYIEVSAGGTLPASLYLLVWLPEANGGSGKWFPLPNPQDLDSAVNSGRTTARWVIAKDVVYRNFHVLVPVAATVTEAWIESKRY